MPKKCDHDTESGRLMGRLEAHISKINENIKDLKRSIDSLNERVSSVEQTHWLWRGRLGAIAFTGSLVSAACTYLLNIIWRI